MAGGAVFALALIALAGQAIAQETPVEEAAEAVAAAFSSRGWVPALGGAVLVLAVMGGTIAVILTSKRMTGASLFNRLFVVVAVTSAFFSGVSSALGFSLITSQESADFFRNSILPPAFGLFVFFLAVAIWVGGGELVRHRDWFRKIPRGFAADMSFFIERSIKLFVIIPILAAILFFVSTWTTVVGIGGVDAVRYTYNLELARLQAECSGITGYRQRDFLFFEDLRLSVADAERVAFAESRRGATSGSPGRGVVADYIEGVAEWLRGLETSVQAIIEGEDPSGADPYQTGVCSEKVGALKQHLSTNAFVNYNRWAREFETDFENFVSVLNRWRHDRRIEYLLEQQVAGFERANPKPVGDARGRLTSAQRQAIDEYADQVQSALRTLVRRQKLAKPPVPIPSVAERSPERGVEIFRSWFEPQAEEEEPQRVPRTEAVVAEEFVSGLSTITPRDAVLKNANIFSDIWALAISWDYAAYILLLAYLFFPSAERAARYKD